LIAARASAEAGADVRAAESGTLDIRDGAAAARR
jgi:hypothetical protein